MIFIKKAIRFYLINSFLLILALSKSRPECIFPVLLMLIWFTWELMIEVKYSTVGPTSAISEKDCYSRQFLVGARDISVALPLLWYLYFTPVEPLSNYALYSGLIFYVLGIFLRFYAMSTLKNYFTMVINVDKAQSIVTTGPYRWIRHPGYFALLLIYLVPTLTLVNNLFILVIIFSLSFLTLSYRIHLEERMLMINFREEYISYSRRVKGALFPRGWIINPSHNRKIRGE